MTFRKLRFGVGFFTVLSLAAWVAILFFVDPDAYGVSGTALFLGTAFSFLTGVFTLTLIGLGRAALGEAGAESSFGIFFRQAFLLALFLTVLLVLARFRLLAWWSVALSFSAVLLVELSVRAAADEGDGSGTA